MADSTTLSIRLPASLKSRLERLAALTRRSNSFLAAEAVGEFVERELAIVEGALRGLADVEAGRVISHDQVAADVRARIAGRAPDAAE